MRSILEELWYGNICPNGGCRELTPEAKQLMKYIADHHDNLQATSAISYIAPEDLISVWQQATSLNSIEPCTD